MADLHNPRAGSCKYKHKYRYRHKYMPSFLALRNCAAIAMRYTAQIQIKIQIDHSICPLAASHDRLTKVEQRTRSVSRVSPCQIWCWSGSFLLLYRLPLFGFFKHPTLLFRKVYSTSTTWSGSLFSPCQTCSISPPPLRSILREPTKTFGSPTFAKMVCCKEDLVKMVYNYGAARRFGLRQSL